MREGGRRRKRERGKGRGRRRGSGGEREGGVQKNDGTASTEVTVCRSTEMCVDRA